jgi:hypothetical protein
MDIQIKIENLDNIRKALTLAPVTVAKHVNTAIKQTFLIDIHNAKQQTTPVDTSNLIGNWEMKLSNLKGTYGPKAKYAYGVHEGTKPHPVGIKKIEGWAVRHGWDPYALQAHINRHGTKANPFLQKALDMSLPNINKRFETALKKAMQEIALNGE